MKQEQLAQESRYEVPYHWNWNASDYNGREYFGYLNIAQELIGNLSGKIVLDAGCGDGRFSAELLKEGAMVYCADYSDRAIALARVLAPGADYSVASLEQLPFEDNKFDAMFLIETLEHIELDKVRPVIAELHRVLKPGAKIVITVPSERVPGHPKHYQHFSPDSLRQAMVPFKVEKITGQNKIRGSPARNLYKLLDNRYWLLKSLARAYNLRIWPRFYNRCEPACAKRLIALGSK